MHTLSAIQLREKFIEGTYSAEQIVRFFLKRAQDLDQNFGAFLSFFETRAVERAQQLDQKRARGETLGKLAAIPIAIKDNMHIEGELTTCGSKFLTNFKAPFDATVIRLIEQDDGLLIGKTNLDEFAMGSSTENSALQQTRNPWDVSRTPGGSSGGSAAAVAARLCPLALGSDTGGSIRQPASLCGVVGFKPSYGRVSRFGLVAFGSSLDQIGPLATSVDDAELLFSVIAQHDKNDSTSLPPPLEKKPFSTPFKVGVPWHFLRNLPSHSEKIFSRALDHLTSCGGEVVEIDLNILTSSIPVYYILATAEASTNLARFDGVRYGVRSRNAKTLKEVYALSKEEGFGPEVKRRILLGTFVLSAGYQDAYYKKAQKVRTLIIEQYKKIFTQCDVVAMPTTQTGAFPIGSKQSPIDMYLEDIFTISANLAGLPAISLPDGMTEKGHPLGLQLIGPQLKDAYLLELAKTFQKQTDYHTRTPMRKSDV